MRFAQGVLAMKKIIALVAASVLASATVFAENTFHIGAYFPISPLTASDCEYDNDIKTSGFGGGFDFTHVADGGFTFKVGLDVGHVSTSDVKSVIEQKDLGGVDVALGFGFGGSFIHNERMTLSLTGDFGFRMQYLSETDTIDLHYASGDVDTSVLSFLFYIGPEISYTFRFNDHVGLFANFGIFYNVGLANNDVSISGSYSGDKYNFGDAGDTYFAKGFTFQPKIGVAFTL